ncbi:adenosylmethionine decarboxylase [Andreprevotia chitinilytica]|uniref:adenosylmethionine decarboxylase n=1 Tax=Andreprevotia chitinilytica TaxID=396808 RepID=UPI0005515BD0|nr:adenosylmethionine decarboxylase [Andreprevotia chitinilytica]
MSLGAGEAIGRHVLLDIYGIAAARLSDGQMLEQSLRTAADAAGATVLFAHFHGFGEGLGVTGVLLLAESHISIHTWPEHGFAAVDIFMCGQTQPETAATAIVECLGAERVTQRPLQRGGDAY